MAYNSIAMAYATIGSNHIYYEVSGTDAPLLLLHGFTGSSQNWHAHEVVFTTKLQTITVDILGHGRSDSPPNENDYTMQKVASDIIALLDKLHIEQTHLLGYSMGGRLALYLAQFFPNRFHSLILESASPGLETAVSRQERSVKDRNLANWIEQNGIAAFVDRWEQLPLWDSQKQLPENTRLNLRQQRLQNNPAGLANSLRGMGTGQQPNLWPTLKSMHIPTHLIVGEFDAKFVGINQRMHAQIPKATLEIMQGAGHTVHLERPSQFQQSVLNFLQTGPRIP